MKKNLVLSWAPTWALLFVPMTASALEAGECQSNEDCQEGAVCEKAQWVEGCDSPAPADDLSDDGTSPARPDEPESTDDFADGREPAPLPPECDTTVHEAEIGRCITPPKACSLDSECGEYERCNKVSVGSTCGGSADGSSGSSDGESPAPADCETESEPAETGTCGPGNFSCESGDDCPREFECQASGGDSGDGCACVTAPCDCDSTEPERTSCVPKKIECDEDSECPEDWVCQGTELVTCTGGGSSGGTTDDLAVDDGAADDGGASTDSGGKDDASDGSGEPKAKDECTTVPQKGACLPKSWSSYTANPSQGGGTRDDVNEGGDDIGLGDGGDDSPPPQEDGSPGSGSPTSADGAENADAKTSKGGCSVGSKGTAPTPGLWVVGIAMMGVLLRRRRAA